MLRIIGVGQRGQILTFSVNRLGNFLEVFDRVEFELQSRVDKRQPLEAFQLSDYPREMFRAGAEVFRQNEIGVTRFYESPDKRWAGLVSAVKPDEVMPDTDSKDTLWLHVQIDYLNENDERLALHIFVNEEEWTELDTMINNLWID